jgi:hypothetical protein
VPILDQSFWGEIKKLAEDMSLLPLRRRRLGLASLTGRPSISPVGRDLEEFPTRFKAGCYTPALTIRRSQPPTRLG